MANDNIPDDNPAKEEISHVLTAGNRAKELVQYILAFSRTEIQKQTPVRPQKIADEALQFLRASIPATIEIELDIDPLCGTILADSTQLCQVFMNLCTNASHAMGEAGGVLRIRLANFECSSDNQPDITGMIPGSYVHLSVEDNGTGIEGNSSVVFSTPILLPKKLAKAPGWDWLW